MLKKTEDFLGRYGRICPIARVLSPVFTGAFYVGLAVAALLLITALIVLFVNVDVEKMLLPPDMKALRDASGAVTEYSLDLGNGIRIVSPASAVTLSHIKTVIYSSIAAWLLLLLVACPVFRFLSVLLRNVGRKEALNEENARMINYIGLVILIGNTLIVALNNLLNYIQINKFVSMSEHRIEYAFSIEGAGIIMGLFILAVGTIYGYACSVAAHEKETLTTAVTRLSGTGGQDGQG